MKPWLKGALLLVLAFALGCATGALAYRMVQDGAAARRGPERADRLQATMLVRLSRELDLRPEQQRQVEVILRESGGEFARLREELGPRYREIRGRTEERIRRVLDADQQTKFGELAEKWNRRIDRRHERNSDARNPEQKRP